MVKKDRDALYEHCLAKIAKPSFILAVEAKSIKQKM